MKEKWLVSFGITHIVSLSFVLTFAVKNALLFSAFEESNSQSLVYIAIHNPTWVVISY